MPDNDIQAGMADESGQDSGLDFAATEYAPDDFAQGEEVVNYFFPVEIVVAGSLAPQEREIIQAQIYQDLHDALMDKLA